MDYRPPPPTTEPELLQRAQRIAGLTLAQLAHQQGIEIPADLRRHKGWVGQLIELALGASAASLAEPDFQQIGVELKSIPIDRAGRPRESTYVCTVPLAAEALAQRWESCWVRRKLARVLWIPVEADSAIALGARRIGSPLLWSPSPEEEAVLRSDWEELMEMICLGELDAISARLGTALQIRPKAASAAVRGWGIAADGSMTRTNPRGFYLRTRFTAALLQRHYAIARQSDD